MLADIDYFLAYPWGRESFLATLPHFLPPPLSDKIKDPLQAMRIRLSQQKTACYSFPLALQLFAFEPLPNLLAMIPDAAITATRTLQLMPTLLLSSPYMEFLASKQSQQ